MTNQTGEPTVTDKPLRKRFIAGAKCPACGVEDKIVMYFNGDHEIYECIDCGFREEENFDKKAPQAKPKPVEVVEQPLQFYPAPKKPSKDHSR